MNDRTATAIHVSIAAVERDTGLSKDTLRVWERRYGFPQPERDGFGERAYPLAQVEKLRVIKRLLDAGHRPGRIVRMSVEQLQHIAEGLAPAPQRIYEDSRTQVHSYVDLVKSHDAEGLKRALSQAVLHLGLFRCVTELIGPLNAVIGEAWMRGQVEVFEEHMYTECVNVVLRNAINTIPQAAAQGRPRVLLTTFPQESHGLGLLMAQAVFSMEGCNCLSLGPQTPVPDIVLAASAHRADIVALSFTASLNPNQVRAGLQDLRAKLPPPVQIWAGGQSPAILRLELDGVRVVTEFEQARELLQAWRHEGH